MGFKPQIHEEAKNLMGYRGDKRTQKAHIILPRSQVGSASNDIGFEKVDGKYIAHVSEYDIGRNSLNINNLKQLYSKNKILKHVKQNSGKYMMKSNKIEKDGTIKIRIARLG